MDCCRLERDEIGWDIDLTVEFFFNNIFVVFVSGVRVNFMPSLNVKPYVF